MASNAMAYERLIGEESSLGEDAGRRKGEL